MNTIANGVKKTFNRQVLRTILLGLKNALLYIWKTFGQVTSYEIISLNLLGLSMVMILINSNPDNPRTVLHVLSDNQSIRLQIAFAMGALGWFILAYKRLWLLVIGAIAVTGYGVTSLVGVSNGTFTQLALTIFVQNIPFALAILRASYAEVESQRHLSEYTEALATLRTVNSFPITIKHVPKPVTVDESDNGNIKPAKVS